jgi:hypothetical protein
MAASALVTFNQANLFRDCPWCGLRDAQFHLLVTEASAKRRGAEARFWSLANCPRCGGVVTFETRGPNDASGTLLCTFPETDSEVRVEHLPEDVEGYYRDAIRVLEAGVPDAAAVQLRRTLEAAAAHFGITSGALVKRIEKLIDEGLITRGFGDVLTHIRLVGNVGAHAGDEKVDDATARRALRFTTQVLRNLFEIPEELKSIDREEEEEEAEAAQ